MQETVQQNLDIGTWKHGKWCNETYRIYEDTEERARIALENAVMREEKREQSY